MAPAAADWHREAIKAAVRMTGTSLTALARQHGYEGSTVRKALARPSPRVEKIIADHLRLKPQQIWPSRYDQNGRPHSARSKRSKLRRSVRPRHGQIRAGALT